MKAAIITIGDELLIGQVVNTNSAWLAAELTKAGFSIENHISISDKALHIKNTLTQYMPENELIILTGGLGPTNDDITKKVLADYFDSGLIFSPEVLSDVEAFINGVGSSMNNLNRDQAMVPEAAVILRNNHGTAPGMWFEHEGRVIISLPGVPREMKGIFFDSIKAKLKDHFALPQIVYKTVMLTGIAEAHLAEKLSEWEESLDEKISLAYLPAPGRIRLRLGSAGNNKETETARLQNLINKLQKIVPKYIYGYDEESLESVVGRMIVDRSGYIATAESCTGGAIASRITAIPGCSSWFKGGIVAYSNEVKSNVLGVDQETLKVHGAVSEETIKEMVQGVQRVLNADYAVATSGIAGPDGGTLKKPVGTVWIAVAGPDFLETKMFTFGNNRELNIIRSTEAAFNMMRKAILKIDR